MEKKKRKRTEEWYIKRKAYRSKTMRRIRLWRKSTKCYWCGCKTVLFIMDNRSLGKFIPDNAATIDHLNRKLSLGVVLACFRCNQERAKHGL